MKGVVTRVRVIHFHLICALLWLLILGDSNVIWAQCRAHPEITPRISEPVANTTTLVTQANVRAPDIIALTTDNKLLRFNSADPSKILSEVPISPTNLQPGESVVALDFNPSQGGLYGLGSTGRPYSIYSNGIPQQSSSGYGPFFSNTGTKIGFDFDPTSSVTGASYKPWDGAIRLVTDAGQNQVLGPNSGFLYPGAQNLAYATGDVNAGHKPNVVALAYSNNSAGVDSTTAYAIDSAQNALVRLGSIDGRPISPDAGQLFTVGSLGVKTSNLVGFDIAAGSNVAYASLTSAGETGSKLYTINLTTGTATLVGIIGSGRLILDITVVPVGYFSWNLISPATYCWITELNESDGIIRFSVTRSGDTSGAVTVDYAPDSSTTAKEGHGVVGMSGRLYFAPGEISKNFTIFITDDAVVWPGYLVVRLIKPTGGYFSGNFWEMEIQDNDYLKPPSTNPIDEARFFVREHYIDFLNREPDSAGLQFWVGQITSCGTDQQCLQDKRQNVSAAFFLSTEFQQTGYLVYRFYKASFGRIPQLTEFLSDKQVISQDVIVNSPGWEQQLEKNKIAFADFWMDRPDFKNLYDDKTNVQYVDALIANTGVAFSQAERDALVNELDNSTDTRASVLGRVAENQSLAQQEFNRAFVLMQYFGYLRRNPNDAPDSDFSGFNFWLTKLNQFNGDFQKAEMVKAFITSGEYRKRFGP